MRARAALLCALIAAPSQGQELHLYLIPGTPAHIAAWQTVEAAARHAGINVVARTLPPDRGMVMANAGEVDGAVGRSALAASEYPNLVQVPEVIYQYAPTAFAYRKIDVSEGWQSLRGHTLCMRRGYTLTERRTGGMQRQRLDSDASLLRMLRKGGCEIVIMDRRNTVIQAALAADPALLELLPPLEEVPLYLFLHRRHADLVPRLAEALRQVKHP